MSINLVKMSTSVGLVWAGPWCLMHPIATINITFPCRGYCFIEILIDGHNLNKLSSEQPTD